MALPDVAVSTLPPERFAGVLTSEGLARFERAIARGRELLGDGALWTVNSTAFGGGVAEMLRSLVGYVRGRDARNRRDDGHHAADGTRRRAPRHRDNPGERIGEPAVRARASGGRAQRCSGRGPPHVT